MAALWDRVQSLVFGAAVGRAGSEAVTPVLEPVRQRAWTRNQVRVLDAGTLAELVAKGFTTLAAVKDEASRNGYNAVRLEALTALAQTYPGLGELDEMSNRKALSPELVDKALSRHGIPKEYQGAVKALFADLLDPAQLAAAVHRNIVPDPGFLVGQQPGPDRKVPIFPKVGIDVTAEYEGQGLDEDRFRTMVGLQGLPMGPHEAAEAYFRQIITHDDFLAAIAQGNTRNEWAEAIVEQTRQIPTARDFLENALRGYHDQAWATEQAARHGMSAADALVIYQNQGRPMNIHDITRALAWGAKFHPEPGELTDPYHASVVEGPVKPGYYEMAESLKYTLPSALYFRVLQQNKVLTPEQAETWYLRLGWPPELAHQVAQAFAKPKGAAEKEATAADLLTLYDGGKMTEAETLAALEALDYPADEAQRKLDLIPARRVIASRNAAIADLHGAYKKRDLDALNTTNALLALGLDADTAGKIVSNWQQFVTATATAPTPPPV
jgi:hypothetical protein